jgi:hypothetical protein
MFNQTDKSEIHSTVMSIGQKECRQMTRAIGQEKKRCIRESIVWEQREQVVSN